MVRLPEQLRPYFGPLKSAYTIATWAVSPATVRLSARRGGWLPDGVAETMEEAAASTGGTCVVARPPEVSDRPARMQGYPPDLPLADHSEGQHVGRVAVAELPGGRVLGPHRAIITADNDLLHEISWYFGTSRPREHPLYLNPFPPEPLEVPGRLGLLAARGDGNYYHFLHDVIARLSVLERWSGAPAIEGYYLPQSTGFQRELAALAGLPTGLVIDSDAVPHLRARRLLVPSLPDLDLEHPGWATEFLRSRLLPADAAPVPGRCIYVTRGAQRNNRIVVNEDAVLEALAPYGVQVVDPSALGVAEQIRAFAEAELVVAPHGAALANLTFASAGAAVVELFAPDFVQGCYWKLSTTVPGLRYRYLVGEGRTSRRREGLGVSADIQIDVRSLKRLVEGVVRTASPDRRGSA